MADESKSPARSSSSGSSRKAKAKPGTAAAAAVAAETVVETAEAPAASAEPAPAQPKPAVVAPAPEVHARSAAVAESNGSGGVALAGLLAGLIGIVLALTYPQWTPIVYGSSGSDKRVTADQVRVETKAEIAALKATVAAMTEKQAALEQAVRTAKLPGILMVAEDLRTALGGSAPYDGTLNLFRALTGGDAAAAKIIASIEARASVGVPGNDELRDRFDEAAHAVLMAEQRPEARGNLASQVSDTVASLAAATMRLRLRLDGVPTGDGVSAIVARAEQSVGNGDMQAAVDTLGVLPEPRAALVQPWIELVRARMAAEAVREELDAYIITTASRIQ